ncbi:hypothetical protein ABIB25_000886 [Nakamurella sp. UYEF19]|uniref:sensor domain-containing protein n=1 Tax=Nakamurella sp. UYEF19 TaxID=1756392 RepID=UPI003391156F
MNSPTLDSQPLLPLYGLDDPWADGPASSTSSIGSGRGPDVTVRRGGGVFSARAWAELLYAVVDLAPSIAFFVLSVTLLSVGVGLSVVYVGLPLLALGLLVARAGGHLQRVLAGVLLGAPVPGPDPMRRRRPGPVGLLTGVLTDPGCWRAVGYHCLKILLAPISFGFAVGFYAAGLGGLSYGLWQRHLPVVTAADGSRHRGFEWWPGYFVETWPRMVLLAVVGALVLWMAPAVVRFFTTIDRVLVASLLGPRGRAA